MKHVLAMYDIRGKQAFIFRTNKLKEIAGASLVIRDLYKDHLIPAAKKVPVKKEDIPKYDPEKHMFESDKINHTTGSDGIFFYKDQDPDTVFSEELCKKHLGEGSNSEGSNYIGEVVYEGGGNAIIIFKSMEHFKMVTFLFTKRVMEEIGSLHVLATAVECEDFENYKKDEKELYRIHILNESKESTIRPWACLPITQIDRKTAMPLVKKWNDKKVSKETYAKLRKFKDEEDRRKRKKTKQAEENANSVDGENANSVEDIENLDYLENVNKFDEFVEKGVNSNIAVIYIDGNNMGAKIANSLDGQKSYTKCIRSKRQTSKDIQEAYILQGVRNVTKALKENHYRIVIAAGDEINFVVKASDALTCAYAYLANLYESQAFGGANSACAGIAVFNSHAPYADAYSLAEECCESAKDRMKELKLDKACLLDFHFIQGAMGTSLEEIRKHEELEVTSRPWLICGEVTGNEKGEKVTRLEDIKELLNLFHKLGRSNVKGLAEAALLDSVGLDLELRRIKAHLRKEGNPDVEEIRILLDKWLGRLRTEGEDTNKKQVRMMIYDAVRIFDEWKDSILEN